VSDRRHSADDLLREALALPPEKRVAWLESACAGDAALLREVTARLDDATLVRDTSPLEALAPGVSLSHYRLLKRLGAGGMGEVWLATDEKLGRKVALKFPIALLSADASSRHRLLREARSAAALDHPSVCRVFELGQAGGHDFIAMELIPGETLASRLAHGPLPVALALEWGADLAAALDEAHRKGIVHRDLKPGNVMITPAGQVKVMDFGLARPLAGVADEADTWTAGLTAPGAIVGTTAYMAPELLKGAKADEKSDLWALGAIVYEMLTGVRPFPGSAITEVIAAILEREPNLSRLPPETPAEVRLLIGRALRKDPARRLRDAGDLCLAFEEAREALNASSSGRTVLPASAPANTTTHSDAPARSALSRRHLMLGTGAIGLLGAAGFGAGAMLGTSRHPVEVPSFQRLTFRRGMIRNARFAPDQQTILYGALWDGDVCRTSSVRPESPESRPLDLPPSTPLSISASGELALLLGDHLRGLWPRGTLARVPLAGGAPRELLEDITFADWSPDGRELAVVRLGVEKDRLEFPIGNVVFEATGSELSFPRISPRGDTVAVFDHSAYFGGSVVIVDRSGAIKYRSPEFLELFGLAWRGEEVWFTGANEQRIARAIHAIAPPQQPRLLLRMPGNVTLHDIATDGRLLIAHTVDRSESAVLPPGETMERNISWLDGSAIADLSSDGRMALLTETAQGGGRSNSAYLRGTDGTPAVRLGEGRALALSPDGRWAAVAPTIPAPYLDLLPTGAGEQRRIEIPGMQFRSVRWLPDGERIVASVVQEGRGAALCVIPLSGGSPRVITPEGAPLGPWAVAPDGSAVAVTSGEAEARIYSIAGEEPRPIIGLAENDRVRAWAEQGLLVTDGETLDTFFVVDPASGQRERWRQLLPTDAAGIMNTGNLVVTPDGRSYGYWWHRALSDLYLVSGV
jgi:eukaryotic-like serine/threonine-protein kinase